MYTVSCKWSQPTFSLSQGLDLHIYLKCLTHSTPLPCAASSLSSCYSKCFLDLPANTMMQVIYSSLSFFGQGHKNFVHLPLSSFISHASVSAFASNSSITQLYNMGKRGSTNTLKCCILLFDLSDIFLSESKEAHQNLNLIWLRFCAQSIGTVCWLMLTQLISVFLNVTY